MTHLAMMFVAASSLYSLPPGLLSALCFVESSHKVSAVHRDDGRHNSVGICQIQLPTAKSLGFKGTESQLLNANINIFLAGRYLALELRRYGGNVVAAVAAYNMGSYRVGASGKAKNQKYVDKVMKAWKEDR